MPSLPSLPSVTVPCCFAQPQVSTGVLVAETYAEMKRANEEILKAISGLGGPQVC